MGTQTKPVSKFRLSLQLSLINRMPSPFLANASIDHLLELLLQPASHSHRADHLTADKDASGIVGLL